MRGFGKMWGRKEWKESSRDLTEKKRKRDKLLLLRFFSLLSLSLSLSLLLGIP
jgi:hypothetical protein